MDTNLLEKPNLDDINSLRKQLNILNNNYEQLKQTIAVINKKHESVMRSVLEHLVHQSTVLSQYVYSVNQQPSVSTKPMSNQICSNEYASLLHQEHSTAEKWGVAAKINFNRIVNFLKSHPYNDILDYGAGSGNPLSEMLSNVYPGKFICTSYDPGIPEINQTPIPHSLVMCIDVLEHVEPEFLDNVLSDLKRVTAHAGFFVISTVPANRILKNGKNAHLIIETADWWIQKLSKYFTLSDIQRSEKSLCVVVYCK
jgi:2-polyprenyl-3-methyl-5-hydroxy-6-metoxy-1,4-benzoquinol methylase